MTSEQVKGHTPTPDRTTQGDNGPCTDCADTGVSDTLNLPDRLRAVRRPVRDGAARRTFGFDAHRFVGVLPIAGHLPQGAKPRQVERVGYDAFFDHRPELAISGLISTTSGRGRQ